LLLATMSIALLVIGGVAASQSPTTTEKSGGDVSIQSTTVKASFANGSGANFLGVKVSDHGNLVSFESPAGQEAVFNGNEGYVVCSGGGGTIHGHDTGPVEANFGAPTFSQPNGAGTFPLTVTRDTTDGKFRLKQVWNKPDAVEKDVTVTMTLKNISSSTIFTATVARTGDFDVGTTSNDQGAATGDSTWLWDDRFAADQPPGGLMLTALSFGTTHFTRIETKTAWNNTRDECLANEVQTPTAVQDLTMRVFYFVGNLSAGQSKSVKFEYGRM